jgi:hypothetical protein
MNLNLLTSVYSTAAAERLACAKQAAEIRRKLISAASRRESEPTPGKIVSISESLEDEESRQCQNPENPLNFRTKQNAAANGMRMASCPTIPSPRGPDGEMADCSHIRTAEYLRWAP